jgi:transcriptional regulator with XRE-family HTH domain
VRGTYRDVTTLVDALANYRYTCGLTQKVIAERMGITQSVVANMEVHRRTPNVASLVRYCAALGLRLTITITPAPSEPPPPAPDVAGDGGSMARCQQEQYGS